MEPEHFDPAECRAAKFSMLAALSASRKWGAAAGITTPTTSAATSGGCGRQPDRVSPGAGLVATAESGARP